MGTRNLTCVVKDEKFRVAQYGQWDGYPSGQGQTIVDFLIEKWEPSVFARQIDRLTVLPEEEIKRRWKEAGADDSEWVTMEVSKRFTETNAHLQRDMGAEILAYIQDAETPEVASDDPSFAADSLFCEWAYVLDLDNETLEVYKGFNKQPLGPDERFHNLQGEGEYHPVKLYAKIPIADLTPDTMSELEKQDAEETP